MAPVARDQHAVQATISAVPDSGQIPTRNHPLRRLSLRSRKPSSRALRAVEPAPGFPSTTGSFAQRSTPYKEKPSFDNDRLPAQSLHHGYVSPGNASVAYSVSAPSSSFAATPTTSYQQSRPRKHSHGLSWSDNTSDSLVDNLVSSLDNLAPPRVHHKGASLDSPFIPNDTSHPTLPPMSQVSSGRSRGHVHNPSISSEAERTESPARQPGSGSPNVRRPSGFSATRILSGTKSSGGDHTSPEVQARGWRSRHGSKSSTTTSNEPASASPNRMREASRERSRAQQGKDDESILSRGRPVPSVNGSFHSAAPEPNIPSGPTSRTASPGSGKPHFASMNIQRVPMNSRKQSSNSHMDLPQAASQEGGDNKIDFARTTSMRSLQQHQSTNSIGGSPAMNKHVGDFQDGKRGFFKRVFGSSNSRSNLVPADMAGSPAGSRQGSLNPHQSEGAQQKPESSPSQGTARELTKKTSAFFRRQKKPMTDSNEPPSLPPLNSAGVANAESPARSSLYKAMDPYLAADAAAASPAKPAARQGASDNAVRRRLDSSPSSETTEDPALFHSGYKQSPDGGIRAVSPEIERSTSDALSSAMSAKDNRAENPSQTTSHSRDNSTNPLAQNPVHDMSDSKGGIQHSLVVNTSSPTANEDEFVVAKSTNGQTEVSRVTILPSPVDGENEESETAIDQEGFVPLQKTKTPEPELSATIKSPNDLLEYAEPPQAINPLQNARLLNVERDSSFVERNMSVATTGTAMTSMSALMEEPDNDDRERALSIYNGEEEIIPREQAAAYLGERKAVNVKTRKAFMDLFNFKEQTVLGGLRMLCNRLVLKAESQQVDRILDCFAARWCDCNPNHGFKLKDVVHTMCYSLLLLNTDLHMADIESKMTRSQFVKNTLPTIKRVVAEAPPEAFDAADAPRPGLQWQDSTNSVATAESGNSDRRTSTDSRRPTLTKRMSWSLGMGKPDETEPEIPQVPNSGSTSLVGERFDGTPSQWHFELESILKSFFTAIKNEALPLNQKGGLRRTNSLKSMAPSEMSVRSRRTDFMSGRWGKNRVRSTKLYASSTMASSRTSFDDNSSMFSGTGASSAWSKLSLGKTLTGNSSDSNGFGADQSFPQNIGFANALSQSNAREDGVEDDCMSINPQKFLLEDDALELAGAPWAKEGMVKHKYHLSTNDKKAKERNWNECFAVVERGYLRLFSFNSKGGKSGSLGVRKSLQKGKAASIAPSVVGGGNWMANAEQMGSFLLRQTIASTLPPPGYSKARPFVWALSLPNGAVHLFQVGTAEIAKEFMNTANYWSARLSKEPLSGGVENTEYGWSENIILQSMINPALVAAASAPQNQPQPAHGHSKNNSISATANRISMAASSMRGSIDHGHGASRGSKPGDKANVENWKPPAQSMMASQLMEVDQLKALTDYVTSVENELTKHNELRGNLPNAYTARNPNLGKALANWEAKSAYLLRETIKFRTYIDALDLAREEKVRFDKDRAEREAEKEERERKKREREAAASTAAAAASAEGDADAAVEGEGTPRIEVTDEAEEGTPKPPAVEMGGQQTVEA